MTTPRLTPPWHRSVGQSRIHGETSILTTIEDLAMSESIKLPARSCNDDGQRIKLITAVLHSQASPLTLATSFVDMVLKLFLIFAMCIILASAAALPGAEKLRYAMPESPAFTIAEETSSLVTPSSLVVPSSRSMIGVMLAAQVAVTPTPTERILAVTPKSRTTTSKSSKITSGSEDCIEQFVCIDYINTCGMRYGG
ncbi:hypothetical protein IWX50DRAFT_700197 [Phyllosticta citricarpa]